MIICIDELDKPPLEENEDRLFQWLRSKAPDSRQWLAGVIFLAAIAVAILAGLVFYEMAVEDIHVHQIHTHFLVLYIMSLDIAVSTSALYFGFKKSRSVGGSQHVNNSEHDTEVYEQRNASRQRTECCC